MRIAAFGGALALALIVSGCKTTASQRCEFYASEYAKFVASGRGGVEEKKAAEAAYKAAKFSCSLQGINI